MRILAGAATDVGRVRERNEDAYLAQEPLFAVADGMGGHRGGAVASQVALEVLGQMEREAMAGDGAASGLADVVAEANEVVLERAAGDRRLEGMGTTLTAVVVQPSKIHLAHVGDSRAYLVRDGQMRQLTEDHTLVRRLVEEGKITEREAEIHPHRSVLTRALGVEGDIDVDTTSLDVHPGDRILLCSDGLTSMVPEDEILRILTGTDEPQAAADSLVDSANAAGGVDNVTALVLFVIDGEATSGRTAPGAAVATASEPLPAPQLGASAAASPAPAATTASPTLRAGTTVYRAEALPGPKPGRGRRGFRILAWVVAVGAVLAVGLAGARAYVYSQWYVGVSEERVALFRGVPVDVLGYRVYRVVEVTDLSATRTMRLRPWSGLADGITAESQEEARSIIETIRRDLQEAERQDAKRSQAGKEAGSG